MKTLLATTALTLFLATSAFADDRIAQLCGPDHVNEATDAFDVTANPDGFYIRSLQTQISHGDRRIIQSNSSGFHLCTASAATPDMDSTKALAVMDERRATYLFVPSNCPKQPPLI